MSNEHMQAPTEEQKSMVAAATNALAAAANSADLVKQTIGVLRDELNRSRSLIADLRGAIGQGAYRWRSDETWHSAIDKRVKEIDKVLK